MERRQQWLGYVAIGLGMLALLVALGGRGDGPRMMWGDYGSSKWAREVPPVQVAPVPVQPPTAPQAPRMPMDEEFFRHRDGPPWAMGHQGGWGHGHPGLFFGPAMVLDKLAKLALIFVLFALGLRFLRGHRGPYGGPPTHGGGGTPPSGGTPTMGPTVRL